MIVLNSYKAVQNVSPSLLAMCRSFLGTQRQQIVKIVLPDAAPLIFAGLRLGVSAGFIGVVLAELLITPTGIGDLITYHRIDRELPEMYADIASIVIFSAVTLIGAADDRVSALPAGKAGALDDGSRLGKTPLRRVATRRRCRTPSSRSAAVSQGLRHA